jgi:protein-arginine kinase activator protein McsA
MQEMLYEIKLKLANENYDLIVENGIDVKSMRGNGYNVDAVKRTLNQMLDIFVEVEEYEKCAKIKDVLDLF